MVINIEGNICARMHVSDKIPDCLEVMHCWRSTDFSWSDGEVCHVIKSRYVKGPIVVLRT